MDLFRFFIVLVLQNLAKFAQWRKLLTCLPSKQHYTSPLDRYQIPEIGLESPQDSKFPNCSLLHLMLWLHRYLNLLEEDPQKYCQIHMLQDKIPVIYSITKSNIRYTLFFFLEILNPTSDILTARKRVEGPNYKMEITKQIFSYQAFVGPRSMLFLQDIY